MRAAAIIGVMILPVTGLVAQEFGLPAGCTAYLTVQNRSCAVEHHFTCEGDADGTQRRVSLSEDGMTYMGQIDAETQWLQSYQPLNGET